MRVLFTSSKIIASAILKSNEYRIVSALKCKQKYSIIKKMHAIVS